MLQSGLTTVGCNNFISNSPWNTIAFMIPNILVPPWTLYFPQRLGCTECRVVNRVQGCMFKSLLDLLKRSDSRPQCILSPTIFCLEIAEFCTREDYNCRPTGWSHREARHRSLRHPILLGNFGRDAGFVGKSLKEFQSIKLNSWHMVLVNGMYLRATLSHIFQHCLVVYTLWAAFRNICNIVDASIANSKG